MIEIVFLTYPNNRFTYNFLCVLSPWGFTHHCKKFPFHDYVNCIRKVFSFNIHWVRQLLLKIYRKQDSIPLACMPHAWNRCMLQFQLTPPDVNTVIGPQMNKFEQVSVDHHQMSLMSFERGYHTMWPIPWCILCYLAPPPPPWADKCLWKHYLPQTWLERGNN